VNFGFEYNPMAKLEYLNNSRSGLDIVDNIAWEPGIFYGFADGFRVGLIFDYYAKTIDRGGTQSADLKSWGIGLVGDYAYEITESGRTSLVGGMESGYGELTDENDYSIKTEGGVWIAGIGGIRHYFNRAFFMEMDFRMKWQQYEFTGVPRKSYDYSGPTIRINLGYMILSPKR